MSKYWKSILTVIATVITAVVAALSGNSGITAGEWVNVAIAGVGACAVFTGANVPGAVYTKTILAVLAAVLAFLTSAIVGGVSGTEWLQIAVIALGAIGVYAVPNTDGNTNLSYTGSVGVA